MRYIRVFMCWISDTECISFYQENRDREICEGMRFFPVFFNFTITGVVVSKIQKVGKYKEVVFIVSEVIQIDRDKLSKDMYQAGWMPYPPDINDTVKTKRPLTTLKR